MPNTLSILGGTRAYCTTIFPSTGKGAAHIEAGTLCPSRLLAGVPPWLLVRPGRSSTLRLGCRIRSLGESLPHAPRMLQRRKLPEIIIGPTWMGKWPRKDDHFPLQTGYFRECRIFSPKHCVGVVGVGQGRGFWCSTSNV